MKIRFVRSSEPSAVQFHPNGLRPPNYDGKFEFTNLDSFKVDVPDSVFVHQKFFTSKKHFLAGSRKEFFVVRCVSNEYNKPENFNGRKRKKSKNNKSCEGLKRYCEEKKRKTRMDGKKAEVKKRDGIKFRISKKIWMEESVQKICSFRGTVAIKTRSRLYFGYEDIYFIKKVIDVDSSEDQLVLLYKNKIRIVQNKIRDYRIEKNKALFIRSTSSKGTFVVGCKNDAFLVNLSTGICTHLMATISQIREIAVYKEEEAVILIHGDTISRINLFPLRCVTYSLPLYRMKLVLLPDLICAFKAEVKIFFKPDFSNSYAVQCGGIPGNLNGKLVWLVENEVKIGDQCVSLNLGSKTDAKEMKTYQTDLKKGVSEERTLECEDMSRIKGKYLVDALEKDLPEILKKYEKNMMLRLQEKEERRQVKKIQTSFDDELFKVAYGDYQNVFLENEIVEEIEEEDKPTGEVFSWQRERESGGF